MSPQREHKIREVIRQSQPDLTVILENIYDPLNISAVLRSCDAVGVREVFVIYTKQYLDKRGLRLGKRTSAGAFKWIDVYLFDNVQECFRRVRERYRRILSTGLGQSSQSLFALDLCEPVALLFGNEDEGVSEEAMSQADGNFLIPQAGFAESLNISVACAVTLFEAKRQREQAGFYSHNPKLNPEQQEQLFQRWSRMVKDRQLDHQEAVKVDATSPELLPVYFDRSPDAPKHPYRGPSPVTKFDL